MIDSVLQRVVNVCNSKCKSVREFANIIGLNVNTVNQQIRGDRSLSLETVYSILSSFEEISSEWLLRGEGNMLKPQPETTYTTQPALINTEAGTPEASALYQIHNDMIKLTRELVEENTKLKLQISELSQSENEIANILKDFRDSNKELSEKNRELTIELMIKDAQIREKEKSNSDYKEILKEAI